MSDSDISALYLSAEQRWMQNWVEGPTLQSEPLRRGQRAPNVELYEKDGSGVPMSSLWEERAVLIMLWRHLGCGCGVERAGLLQQEYQRFVDSGLDVVVVAPGDPERVAEYRERYQLPARTLADPTYEAHKAFGLSHWSLEQVLYDAPDEYCELRPETGEEFQNSRREQGRPLVDDPWMQSGEFIVGSDGVIRVAYLYNYCEDYPDPRVFTTAARLAG